MKKVIAFLCIFSFTFSCIPDVGNPSVEGIDDGSIEIIPQEGNTVVDLKIDLPSGAILNESDLSVSSIFTSESKQNKGGTSVEIFEGDGLELTFATDKEQNIILFSFVNPNDPSSHIMDAGSTAQALLLMHPWSMDLSLELKKQVLIEVLDFPEYESLRANIEIEISKETVDLLNNEIVISSLSLLVSRVLVPKTGKQSEKLIDELKEPLNISTTGNTLTLTNINNSMAYGVKLLGEDGTSLLKTLPDVDKNLFSLDQIGRIITLNGFKKKEIMFDIVKNQQYSIIAKNGLVFDGSTEDNAVFNRNAGKISINLLGIVSSSLKRMFSNDKCLDALGKYAFQNISETFLKISSNQISNSDFLDDNLDLLKNNTVEISNVLKICGSPLVKGKRLQILISNVVKVKEVFNAVEFGLLVVDWARYNNEIIFCIDKSTGEVVKCKEVTLAGDLIFNKVPIGKPQTRKITLRNNGLEPFNIKEFKYPAEGFISEPLIGENGLLLENGKSKDFDITFNPETPKDYSGEFVVITAADSSSVKLEVNAKGVIALTSDKTELDFGKLLVDQSSDPQTISLKNDSDVDIVLKEVAAIEGYEFSIPEQTIPAGQTISIEVVFKPTDDFEDYNKSLIFKTDTDQQDLIVQLIGDGFKGLNLEILSIPNNLDFGKVDITSETGETKSLRLSNPTDISISISGFVYTNEADGGYYTTSLDTELANAGGTIELPAGTSRDFTITFKPEILGFYNGDFVIDNTESQDAPIRVPIMGEAVLNEISINPDFLDFGEVEVGSPPETRTFTITNNLKEEASISIVPDDDEITTNWNNGTVLPIGVPRTVTVQFNPTSNTTTINGTIQIEATNLNQFAVVSYTARKKENITNILDGNWMPTWVVTTCEPTATSNDMGCINHQNTRPYVFIPTPSATCQELLCGIMDFNNIRNGNSDSAVINNWEYDGTNVTINIRSDSNGFFFLTRTFTFSGIFDQNTNTIVGQYISEYTGGGTAGWKNKATGTLTLTRE